MSSPLNPNSIRHHRSHPQASPSRANRRNIQREIGGIDPRNSISRSARNQPSYDFLTGESISPAPQALRQTLRQSQAIKPDHANEDLRAEIKSLRYELENYKQERELASLRHEKELREEQSKSEAEYNRAQALENSNQASSSKFEGLSGELKEAQDRFVNEKLELEKRLRSVQDENLALQEGLEEAQSDLSSTERQYKHQLNEAEARYNTLQRTTDELRQDLGENESALHTTQQKLSQRASELGRLESEILRLKAHTGDTNTLDVIKRELSEQVAHIKNLESTNRDQLSELKHYRKLHKSIAVVEEEKKLLEGKVRLMEDLRLELGEAQLQRQILEDERKSWTMYLQREASTDGTVEFDSPEALAKALVEERLGRASLLQKLGGLEPELSEKDLIIKSLEAEKTKMYGEVEKLRANSGTGDPRLKARLERQKALAVKEVEYLREQLKTFDTEESTFQAEGFDEQKTRRIQELEDIVDRYRKELQDLNEELMKKEESTSVPEAAGTKRLREEEPDERLGQLSRKNRKLQDEIGKLNQFSALLKKELDVHKNQLATLKATPRTRILELRSNPTADAEALKMSTLTSLRKENETLLAQLEGRPQGTEVVPIATLDLARADIRNLEKLVADKEKMMMRLKQIWGAKSSEFREAVESVLGWKMEFMPNDRVRVTSLFYLGEEEGDNSIIFDGANGKMKISGGPNSMFGLEIKNQIRFWVEERKEIPCFLAALTLEFYEKTTRAARI
ncbi:MAG: coiled-coil domain-containing protein mad1 [Candelina mexicana]|nr:MAG: coiled-coil domain-containing protein mad1 [Candelina mexicana]